MIFVLLIDDNPQDIEIAKFHLNKHFNKISFTYANDLNDYKEKLNWVKPDVIICDYNLGGDYGIDVLLDVKSKGIDVPFIFFTGTLNDESKAIKAVLEGASNYVLKENVADLPLVVEEALEKYNQNKAVKKSKIELLSNMKFKLNKAILSVNDTKSKNTLEHLSKDLEELMSILI